MNRIITILLSSVFLLASHASVSGASPDPAIRSAIVGDAVLQNDGYRLLEEMTTRFGPRMAGTPGSRDSMDFLEAALQELGIATRREAFTIPGWVRGADRVRLVSEPPRELRATALGYVDRHEPLEADVVLVDSLDFDQMEVESLRGKIALFVPNLRPSDEECKQLAEAFGVVGVLRINRVDGGQVLARTSGLTGEPPPFPIYSITVEEGRWMQRQLEAGMPVRVRLETQSYNSTMEIENLVAVLPGRTGEKVVVGAHFDSWDLGQGAIDNGLGVAQLYDVARLLKRHAGTSEHTIELVFFNAEEWGLWGSWDYAERHDLKSVRCMINLDMVGKPIAVNAMGFDALVPFLEEHVKSLGAWKLNTNVENKPWLGSDHHPFIIQGVPAITYNAPVEADVVKFYHDFSDTFEKVDSEMLSQATALVALLTYDLAMQTDAAIPHLNEQETAELFRKAKLEERMRKADQWPFGDPEEEPETK